MRKFLVSFLCMAALVGCTSKVNVVEQDKQRTQPPPAPKIEDRKELREQHWYGNAVPSSEEPKYIAILLASPNPPLVWDVFEYKTNSTNAPGYTLYHTKGVTRVPSSTVIEATGPNQSKEDIYAKYNIKQQ